VILCVVRLRAVLVVLMVCLVLGIAWGCLDRPRVMTTMTAPEDDPPPITSAINTILHLRSLAILNSQTEGLHRLYDLSVATGRWALERETRRVKYVGAWAEKRGLKIVEVSADGRIVRMEKRENSIWAYVIQSAGFGYVYLDDPEDKVHRFGVGTRHVMELALHGNSWVLKRDWYTDPLDEDTVIPDVTPAATEHLIGTVLASELPYVARRQKYQRAAAVQYANTYCGAAWGCGNEGRYNQDYRDYTGLGGDCTNFASQVLGDPDAGALPGTSVWHYAKQGWRGAGSTAWVKADAFGRYLSHSGTAHLVGRGTYRHIVEPASNEAMSLIARLEPGDLIAYEEKRRIVHFAVVTNKDSKGVLLVNSHTVDRYQVPWDLGWDQKTVFWLFHVHD
jgi:hypothetical protein